MSSPSLPKIKFLKQTKKNVFSKKICGDIFSSSADEASLLGFLYHARLAPDESSNGKHSVSDFREDQSSDDPRHGIGEALDSNVEIIDDDDTDGIHVSVNNDDSQKVENLDPKQRLALTIQNWSLTADNDKHIIEEGAVHALVSLSGVDDNKVRNYCAGAFYHLSTRTVNRLSLLSLGTVAGIVEISRHAKSMCVNCLYLPFFFFFFRHQ
jgi:hypothetical protein